MSRTHNRALHVAHAAPAESVLFREEIQPPTQGMLAFSIRKDASADEVLNTLHGACEAYKNVARVTMQIKLVIGKTLAVVRERKLFGKYKNFEQFIIGEVVERYGIGRSTAWEAIKVAQAFPEVDAATYNRIGAEKLITAARIAPKIAQDKRPDIIALLDSAKPVDEVKAGLMELTGLKPKDDVAQLVFRVPPAVANEWREWTSQEAVKEQVGGETTGDVFRFVFELAKTAFRPSRPPKRKPAAGVAA